MSDTYRDARDTLREFESRLKLARDALDVTIARARLIWRPDGFSRASRRPIVIERFRANVGAPRRRASMLDYQKPMFSDDDEQRPLMSEEELRDACLHAAATIVIAVALGCEFEDCRLTDDGYRWPTSISRIDLKYPKDWNGRAGAFSSVATIHEAGAMAVAKRHGRGPHLINHSFSNHNRTRQLLDIPSVWGAIEALASFLEDSGDGGGCYGAMGSDAEPLEDSQALRLIIDKLIGDADPTPDTLQ
jgi:hypothetical protein